MLRWVDQARLYPARCAVLPQLGSSHHLGYIDCGVDTPSGERVYVSVMAADMLADARGFRRPGDVQPREAELKRLRDQVAELEMRVAAQAAELEAVHVLKRGGFASSRKPGRPKAAA